jgi:hypothetical protein
MRGASTGMLSMLALRFSARPRGGHWEHAVGQEEFAREADKGC